MGKTHTGLTIFWPDDGLDEGPIMLQKTCAIGADETLGDIYFKKLFPMGVDAMIEGLDMVKAGVIIKHDQRLEDGTYEGWFKKDSAKLDWTKPVAETYNTIRAANPAPGAWTTLNGAEVKIYDAARMDGDGTPGEIIDISEEGVTVQGNGGRILIKRVRPEATGKIPASEWASAITLKIGTTLGS
jgi:methionyl-tRNA formyltransferase